MSPVSPGLYPSVGPRPTKSKAEQKVYEVLKASLPTGWYAWHSLKLRTRKEGKFSEADFIIADPDRPGILIIEVKGGKIELRDGLWYQNRNPMSPFAQAHSFCGKLIERFKENNVNRPKIGFALCFPDTFYNQQPTQDDLQGLIIGKQDLPHLERILPEIMEYAVPNPVGAEGPWVNSLHDLWGENWPKKIPLGTKIQFGEPDRIQLDKVQLEKLDEIEENDRVLIRGSAGTGKTLLACEAAKRLADRNKKVLLLCYTDALGKWLAKGINHPKITCKPVRTFAEDLAGYKITRNLTIDQTKLYEQLLIDAVDGLPDDFWDCVIVDEGQDFTELDWGLVEECTCKPGYLWVFADENQAFWSDRKIPENIQQEFFRFRLSKPYRCPPEIQHLADCYAKRCPPELQILKRGVRKDILRVKPCSEQRITKQVGNEIKKLLSEGLQPYEITVISVRGMSAKENICHNDELGGHRIVRADDNEASSQIICDTFLRFKGLERPAVIVTDLRLVSNMYEMRMHTAVSRALNFLCIVGVETEIRKDPTLAELN